MDNEQTTKAMYDVITEESIISTFVNNNMDYFNAEMTPDMFTGARAIVFGAARDIIKSGETADLVSICSAVKGQVDVSEVVRLVDSPLTTNLSQAYKRLEKCRRLRQMYLAYGKGLEHCKNGKEPSEIFTEVQSETTGTDGAKARDLTSLCHEVMDEVEVLIDSGKPNGLSSGIRALDKTIGGFMGNEFVIVAGRPGDGKTILGMNIARNMGFANVPGLIFSLEMTGNQLVKRMACDIMNIPADILFQQKIVHKNNHHVKDKLVECFEMVQSMPFEIDATPKLSIDQIYARSKRAKITRGIKWVLVDYLGLIDGWTKDGQGPKAEITRQLKLLAKDIDATVIVLCQMNRSIESRNVKAPKNSDLRDAGSIEQDSDIILFPRPFRPEPGSDEEKKANHKSSNEGPIPAIIYVTKNRKGAVGMVDKVSFEGQFFRYQDAINYNKPNI